MLDLDSMSKDDLENLLKDVQKALALVEKRRRAEARAAAEEAAKQFGLSLTDVLGGDKGAGKNPPKYRNPDNPDQTWNGRGRQPNWLKERLANGETFEDLRI